MSLTTSFVCTQCGTIDDITATHQDGGDYLCHSCKHGDWHGYFPKVTEAEDPDHGPMLNRVSTSEDYPDFT